jgi:uncharacterized 2Fe-2S/4Fe-4S cluster protein (DUF4445 family)
MTKNMEIEWDMPPDDMNFQILDLYEPQSSPVCDRGVEGYGLAVDIGTTTIAFELADMQSGGRAGTHTMVNGQRRYAADVVTRIQLASQGEQEKLHESIINDINEGIGKIILNTGIPANQIKRMVITGNTTMLHLLLDMPCESLGQYPFTPVSVALVRNPFKRIFGKTLLDAEVIILPGVSAFVGADIVAGLHFCDTHPINAQLLIDLGTNGEMALITKNTHTQPECEKDRLTRTRCLVTSTAAGPAFEAGNISNGMGSVPGAIARIRITDDKKVEYETIGNQPPLGICGTGVVDITAQLVRRGLVDETGLLDDLYFDTGFPVTPSIMFTQKDIREIQLAKSAVRSGIEILLISAGLTYADIDRVYLAGGFGHKMDLNNARVLGIIPEALLPKVVTVGNSALGGCMRALLNVQAEYEMEGIAKKAEEINLSAHPKFNDLFMDHMMFPPVSL